MAQPAAAPGQRRGQAQPQAQPLVGEQRLQGLRLEHPCPRKLHHPGERCACAARLDVRVPSGHSRQGDLGHVHAARVQNLRWRLSFPRDGAGAGPAGGGPGGRPGGPQGPAAGTLPHSLEALARDHPGGAAAKALRPLSPEPRAAPRLRACRAPWGLEGLPPPAPPLLRPRKLLASPVGLADSPRSSASTDLPASPRPRLGRLVSFPEHPAAEVPLLDPHCARRPRRPPAELPSSARIGCYNAEEQRARANMAMFAQNSRRMSNNLRGCLEFVRLFRRGRRSAFSPGARGVSPRVPRGRGVVAP